MARFCLGLAALLVAAVVTTLSSWSCVPLALGWRPAVVASGSMAPALAAGDLVLVEPDDGSSLATGAIVVLDRAGTRYTHRVVAVLGPGRYRTRGDANPTADSTPLTAAEVVGVVRLRVPFAGVPLLALRRAPWTQGLPLVVTLVSALHAARYALLDAFDPWATHRPPRPRAARAVP